MRNRLLDFLPPDPENVCVFGGVFECELMCEHTLWVALPFRACNELAELGRGRV